MKQEPTQDSRSNMRKMYAQAMHDQKEQLNALPVGQPVITCWLDFENELPQPMQSIYVLDAFGEISPKIHQDDWQKEYWVTNGYLWTARPVLAR